MKYGEQSSLWFMRCNMKKIYALCDCNNFYVSCERLFCPSLNNKPVVVLSNNDGCIIARSNEAKAIGIAMGEPIFKVQDLVKKHQVQVYSANFCLYGDLSRRVMSTLSQFSPNMEVYSVDESFLSLDGFANHNLFDYAKTIRQTVRRNIGLPISIGIASTKTLAKIANRIAKKSAADGVFCFLDHQHIDSCLEKTAVENVWGIGPGKSEVLKRHGIENALQLKQAQDSWIKKNLTVISLKTVWELRGISCLPLEEVAPDKKAIGVSRTFGHDTHSFAELREAISAYIARAAKKLRSQNSVCGHIQVYIATNPFKGPTKYSNAAGMDLTPPCAYTPRLIELAGQLLRCIYKSEYTYKRAGVLLTGLEAESSVQEFLFDEHYQDSRRQQLMKVMDRYNSNTNFGKMFWAAEGITKPWFMKQAHKSQRYTTRWSEILTVKT